MADQDSNPSGAMPQPAAPEVDPAEAELTLARAWLRSEDHAAAEEAARRALALNPQLAEAETIIGRARLRRDDLAGAEEAAQRVLALDPRLAEAEAIIGLARLRGGDLAAAEKAAQRARALDPQFTEAETIIGWARLRRDDLAGAEEAAQRVLALNPRLAEAETIIGLARLRGGDLTGAEEAARRALASDPRLAAAEAIVARARLRQDDLAGAEEAARRALALNPRLAEAEAIIGLARLRGGDLTVAEEAAQRARALDPQFTEAETIIGWARLRRDDFAGAEEAARRALALSPRLAEAETIIGWARFRRDDCAGAEEAARRALAVNPRLAEAEAIIAAVRLRRHDFAGAEEAAQRALMLNPGLAEAGVALAEARLQGNDPAAAEAAALEVLSQNPRFTRAAVLAASAAGRQGEVDRTIAHLRRLAELVPDDPRWPLRIVDVLNVAGQVEEASRELRGVTKRWPSNRVVEYFLQRSSLNGDRSEQAIRAQPELDETTAAARLRRTDVWALAEWRALFKTSPSDTQLARPIVVDHPESDVLMAECPGAETLVIVFTDLNDRMWVPLTLFDRYLAALGVSAVYLKDFRRLLFVRGVKSLGERHEDTLTGVRSMMRRSRARRLSTIGHSGGARPAIRYGVELGAAGILGFGAATGPAPCLYADLSLADQIVSKRVLQHAAAETLDMKAFLESRRHHSKITLCYATEAPAERDNAHRLSGLEGVRLYPVEGPIPTLLSFARQDRFLPTLAGFLGL